MMIIPIFLPSPTPPKCPSCHKQQSIKNVCAHCGYEYAQGKGMPWWLWVAYALPLLPAWVVCFRFVISDLCGRSTCDGGAFVLAALIATIGAFLWPLICVGYGLVRLAFIFWPL